MTSSLRTVVIFHKIGERLGLTIESNLKVSAVTEGGAADRLLQVGDRIVEVNGILIENYEQLPTIFNNSKRLEFTVYTTTQKRLQTTALNAEAATFLKRRGFRYFIEQFEWDKTTKTFGMVVKDYQARVVAAFIEKGSVASEKVRIGDCILRIDGAPVFNRKDCAERIIAKFRRSHSMTLLIERPDCKEAKDWCRYALAARFDSDPSVSMGSDVIEIAECEARNLPKQKQTVRGIMDESVEKISKPVSISDKVVYHQIGSDKIRKGAENAKRI